MDINSFHRDLKLLVPELKIKDNRLRAAEKAAFLTMAHHIDLPDAQDSGNVTISSSTPNYELELTGNKTVDRITSAVFVSGTTKQPLEDWNIRTYQYSYRGVGTSGVPYAFCYYNDELWLYYIPNLSGTVYFTCQHVVTELTDFPDNYLPLMFELVCKQLFKRGTPEWLSARREGNTLIKSFKSRMHPIKTGMEKTTYRTQRIRDLNSLI